MASPTSPTSPTSVDKRSRREQRRLQHQDLSRGQLLDAARRSSGARVPEATLREVAELAEFSVGSVYSFFASKDDLFRQIFVRRGEEFMPACGWRCATTTHRRRPAAPTGRLEVGFFRATRARPRTCVLERHADVADARSTP